MSLTDARAAVRAAKTRHADTLPQDEEMREKWKAERKLLEQVEASLTERLNERRRRETP